jgi:hypothetical protein
MPQKEYLRIAQHYEACLERHGDTCRGVDWPNEADALKRYRVMLEVIREREEPVSLLDFGCGASHLWPHVPAHVAYAGADVSPEFLRLSRAKYPENTYFEVDILEDNTLPEFDYIVANGVFTERTSLSRDAMWEFFTRAVEELWLRTKRGLAFNLMSKHVDWERDDLFHVAIDEVAGFLVDRVSRHFVVRNDYGLYEYTVYVYREPLEN